MLVIALPDQNSEEYNLALLGFLSTQYTPWCKVPAAWKIFKVQGLRGKSMLNTICSHGFELESRESTRG